MEQNIELGDPRSSWHKITWQNYLNYKITWHKITQQLLWELKFWNKGLMSSFNWATYKRKYLTSLEVNFLQL